MATRNDFYRTIIYKPKHLPVTWHLSIERMKNPLSSPLPQHATPTSSWNVGKRGKAQRWKAWMICWSLKTLNQHLEAEGLRVFCRKYSHVLSPSIWDGKVEVLTQADLYLTSPSSMIHLLYGEAAHSNGPMEKVEKLHYNSTRWEGYHAALHVK